MEEGVPMNKTLKRTGLVLVAMAIVAGVGFAINYAYQFASTAAAYKAKIMCSGVFVSHREPQSILAEDLGGKKLAPLRFVAAVVDKQNRQVSTNVLGVVHKKAIFRPGLGCTLVVDGTPHPSDPHPHRGSGLTAFANNADNALNSRLTSQPLPKRKLGHWTQQEISRVFNAEQLHAAVNWAFFEPDLKNPRHTRAVVILYDGKIAEEKYATGFDQDTRLSGWSMTKSVVNALVGVLVKQGILDINKPAPVHKWQGRDDLRRKITVNQLMHMDSGLQFVENYNDTLSDVTRMLFDVGNAAAFAVDKPLNWEPGTHWSYSSGSPVIVCLIIKNIVGENNYLDFPRRALFDPLGMRSAIIEPDAEGTLLGSSYMYATPRDWARLGQLYLQDGVWEGKRILPQGWVEYSTTPVPISPRSEYGSYFWLKLPKEFQSPDHEYALPKDAFHAAGYDGQLVTIIPSRKLVIVRMGLTRYPIIWPQDEFVNKILAAMR
jgi:CubicO group peptidase (beta-lactamase class C family)